MIRLYFSGSAASSSWATETALSPSPASSLTVNSTFWPRPPLSPLPVPPAASSPASSSSPESFSGPLRGQITRTLKGPDASSDDEDDSADAEVELLLLPPLLPHA